MITGGPVVKVGTSQLFVVKYTWQTGNPGETRTTDEVSEAHKWITDLRKLPAVKEVRMLTFAVKTTLANELAYFREADET